MKLNPEVLSQSDVANEFIPLNSFEESLAQAQRGLLSAQDMIISMTSSVLSVPSAGDVLDDGTGFSPLLFDKAGVQMLGCFSDKARIGKFAEITPYCLDMKGIDLLRRVARHGCGIVVNPGLSVGFDMSPDGVARAVEELSK